MRDSSINSTEQEILILLDEQNHTLNELVAKIDNPKSEIENGIRRLLKRRLVGETSDWKFFISMRGEQYLRTDN